ncbi:MAG: YraN family protein [Dehalococcoidales bacterium]|nr:YraN family protein [Dehalococcoidales bacterium]
MSRKETGQQGEILAQKYLIKHGYKILETNYRSRYGEIDIISKYKSVLVFTEVRTKNNLGFGTPEESVTEAKATRLRNTAYYYLETHEKLPEQWRIDLIAIELNDKGKVTRINLVESAIEEG